MKAETNPKLSPSRSPDPGLNAGAPKFDLVGYLAARRRLIEQALESVIIRSRDADTPLAEAMRYSVFVGGKRLRPILALGACEAVGGRLEQAMGLACAIEMIHTYSMIHDDLPCMDNDDLRRGKPTNHRVYGEALAVLAGDALLTDAFAVVARSTEGVSPETALAVVRELAEAAGSRGMVGGQAMDIVGGNGTPDLRRLETQHHMKTGALIRVAVRGGAMLGGADARQLEALSSYGRSVGLAFQVVDDILDVEGSAEEMGKRTHKDAVNGKVTYPALVGVDQARRLARELEGQALEALKDFDESADALREIARFAVRRTL